VSVPHTHTHTNALFRTFHPPQAGLCPGRSRVLNRKMARGRETKTETAPRKNSLGPTIKWQGESELPSKRATDSALFRRPGRTPEGKVRAPSPGGRGCKPRGVRMETAVGVACSATWLLVLRGAWSVLGLLRVADWRIVPGPIQRRTSIHEGYSHGRMQRGLLGCRGPMARASSEASRFHGR
jgi:hypothetical protein